MKIVKLLTNPMVALTLAAVFFSGVFILADKSAEKLAPKTVQAIPEVPVKQSTPVVKAGKNIKRLKVTADNTILIFDEIGANSASIANKIIALSNSSEPILVLINSPGGSVLDGGLIVSAIEASKAPVYTVCMQLCASMAAHIHQAGNKRYMIDRSILMFHPASGGVQGTTYQMEARLSTLKRYVNKMNATAASKSGIALDKFLQMQAGELWLDAEDSLSMKLADGLVTLDLSSIDTGMFSNNLKLSSQTINKHIDLELSDF